MERTLVLIKPDGVQRRLVGEVLRRLEQKGLKLVAIKMLTLDDKILATHYSHLADKPFYPEIAGFMKSAPVVATCWEGIDAVAAVREMCGVTNSRKASPGTIRGDLAMSIQANIVHASDETKTAIEEIKRFFKPEEILEYHDHNLAFGYSKTEAKQ